MSTFAAPQRAFAREVAVSYARCLREDASLSIDVAVARAQHAEYVATLRRLGVVVDVLPADPACPDCCFIEDAAVLVTGTDAVLSRPGAPSRRAEVACVDEALERAGVRVRRMTAPAMLDGGDVLRAGARMFVGLSTRTNRAGADFVATIAGAAGVDVVPVEVRGGLHLKSACTLASASLLVVDAARLREPDLAAFRAAGLECIPAGEPEGANVLAVGRAVIVSAAAPRTAAALAARGLEVHVVDVSELHKGDGALTCLSLRAPPDGAWSA